MTRKIRIEISKKFTLHFATINTETVLKNTKGMTNLHYTLLLLIPVSITRLVIVI